MVDRQKRTYKGTTRTLATDTHCANGHPWTPESTYTPPNGQKRVCRICQRNAQQRYHNRTETDAPMGPRNADKTHCPRGHAYAEDGYVKSDGARGCRVCHNDSRVRNLYGLAEGDYDLMMERQGGRCAGCRRESTRNRLSVDHDHACCPGKGSCGDCVRGLLCDDCNLVLGKVRDEADTLERLAAYVRRGGSMLS